MQVERPVGPVVTNWQAPSAPPANLILEGAHARLEPMSAEAHAALLFPAYQGEDWVWDYLPYGPFASSTGYYRWVQSMQGQGDPLFFAIKDKDRGHWGGVASYLRVTPEAGTIEVGHINLAPRLQRSRAASEAMFLMMQWAFDAGYRRYEWKCDALNRPSRVAAQRFGFSYEGVFRQATVVKGRNRDTAWFAVTDQDWPALKEAWAVWLNPANFDTEGQQVERLADLTRLVRVVDDPGL